MSELRTLQYFMQGYLHQDWPDDFSTVWEAVEKFKNEEPARVEALRADVIELIAERRSEDALRALLVDEFGTGYWAPGDAMTFSEWLLELKERLN